MQEEQKLDIQSLPRFSMIQFKSAASRTGFQFFKLTGIVHKTVPVFN